LENWRTTPLSGRAAKRGSGVPDHARANKPDVSFAALETLRYVGFCDILTSINMS